MIEAKRKYQPSLDPISEVFELEQLSIVRPVVREGSIRREGGLFASWKDRIFVFLYVPQKTITCSVYKKNSECPEEVLDLAQAKMSKKCTQIDGKICFGVVTALKQKYILSLKTGKECLKLFYEVISAKKLLKYYDMWKDGVSRYNSVCESVNKAPLNDTQNSSPLGSGSRKTSMEIKNNLALTSNEIVFDISESDFNNQQKVKSQEGGDQNDILNANTADTIKSKPEITEVKRRMTSIQGSERQEPTIDPLDREEYEKLEDLQGFKAVEDFKRGKIYQNSSNAVKIVASLNFAQSARSIIELFIHLQNWNNKIKDLKVIKTIEKGVYKFAISLHRTGCFSKERRCEAIVTFYKIPDGYFMIMRTTEKIPPHIKKEQWIHFKMAVRIKESLHNFSEKKMIVCLESTQSGRMLMDFAKEIQSFQEHLKTKVKLPEKSLEAKAMIIQ